MICHNCQIQMKIENEAKENGFWFLWYRCSQCQEGYLHKSPAFQTESKKNKAPLQQK